MATAQLQRIPTEHTRREASIWLALCLALVAAMIVIGGLTRLTESGLSIVEWKPVTGIIPPLSDDEFQMEFDAYKVSPQFRKAFPDMSLGEFKHIFWLEFIHRLLGRLAGAVFLVPLLWYAATRALPWSKLAQLAAIFTLGGAQGLIGWYMVKSGLIDDPHVSVYRLALHLATGFTLFGLILWQMLTLTYPVSAAGDFTLPAPSLFLKCIAGTVVALIFCQIVLGAAVAGLHAGLAYNTFPLMEGQWLPEGLWPLPWLPWYRNVFEDVTTAQFIHRVTAYLTSFLIAFFWVAGRSNPHVAHLLPILFSVLVVQFLLGVLTLLFVVPIPLASLHQANAVLLFGIAVTILHRLCIPLKSITYDTGSPPVLA